MKKRMIIIAGVALISVVSIISLLALQSKSGFQETQIKLDKYYYNFFTRDEIEENGFVKKLDQYDTEVSVCFLDDIGLKHLYVFAAPIRYQDQNTKKMILIDDRIINCKDDTNYSYEISQSDFDVKFPRELNDKTGIILSKSWSVEFGPIINNSCLSRYTKKDNFIDEIKNVVCYDDIFEYSNFITYPTILGTENEIIINRKCANTTHKFWLNITDAEPVITDSGYILIKDLLDKEKILGIIQPPILKDSVKNNPNISIDNMVALEKIGNTLYELEITLDNKFLTSKNTKYPIRYNLPIEIRRDKQPDTQVYSNQPDKNMYLSNFTSIGNNEKLGIGKCYIRFILANLFSIDPQDIQSVNYYTYSLNKASDSIKLYEVLQDWCSLTSNWNTPIETGPIVAQIENNKKGEHIFNITNNAKKWFDDEELLLERYGLMMKSESEDNSVFLSHDNALYQVKTEIIFK